MSRIRRLPWAVLFLLWTPSSAAGQNSKYEQSAPPDAYEGDSSLAYYGSENPWNRRMFTADRAAKWHKRRGQRQLLGILDGHPREAAQWCEMRLEKDPQDLESLFVLTVAFCELGEPQKALETMRRAIDAGLPLGRFLAGPRRLLEPLTSSEPFRSYVAKHPVDVIHGPMLGNVTDRSASLWMRAVRDDPITIRLFGDATSDQVLASAVARPDADRDFTAIVELAGLKPSTEYFYDAVIAGKSIFDGNRPNLRTYPPKGSPCVVRVGFGGGAGFTPVHERMWDTIAARQLDGFLFLGDNVYIDLPEHPGGLHRYTYYRRQSRPEFRHLVQATPVYAIWDDHDCAIDDCWMGPYVDKPAWKQPMLAVFRENWINPAYGDEQTPGCWFRFSIGDVDFFMLDCRFYRTNPYGKTPTMLGPVQKAWLHKALSRSRGQFKVLVSSVSWAPETKPGSRDTWDGFADEREEIFSWIDSESIGGVVLVSADRHRSDAWKIERTDGYTLYDLTSSRLTNLHKHECFDQALFCYNEQCSFGALTFDTKSAEPQVTFEIVDIDGKTVHALAIRKSQLMASE